MTGSVDNDDDDDDNDDDDDDDDSPGVPLCARFSRQCGNQEACICHSGITWENSITITVMRVQHKFRKAHRPLLFHHEFQNKF